MALYVFLIRQYGSSLFDYLSKKKIEYAGSVLSFFRNVLRLTSIEICVEENSIFSLDLKNASWDGVKNIVVKKLEKMSYGDLSRARVHVEFVLNVDEVPFVGYVEVNNDRRYRNIYGDVEVDIYSNRFYDSLADFLVNHDGGRYLNEFIFHLRRIKIPGLECKKAVLGFNVDAVEILSEPSVARFYSSGRYLLEDMLKTIKYGSKENGKEKAIWAKIGPYDKKLILSGFWRTDEFRDNVNAMATSAKINILPGSYIMFTKDPNAFGKLYTSMLNEYFEPLANELRDNLDRVKDAIKKIASKKLS